MDQISEPEARIYRFLSAHPEEWLSNSTIAAQVKGYPRTVRLHTRAFFEHGLLAKIHVYPGDRFRWAPSKSADEDYLRRLEEAAAVLLPESEPKPRVKSRRS